LTGRFGGGDHDLHLLGDAFEPRRGVDRVADGGELEALGRADVADQRRAGVQPDADPELAEPAVGEALEHPFLKPSASFCMPSAAFSPRRAWSG
jgi:hypothetical protein